MEEHKTIAGVWIDQKKAVVVILDGEDAHKKVIQSNIDNRERFDGEKSSSGRYGGQNLDDERNKENRLNLEIKRFLKSMVDELKMHHQLVLFGPAQTKIDLEKEFRQQHELSHMIIDVQPADKMTENQIVAWVKKYYSAL